MAVAAPWFQPKSKNQYIVVMLILVGAIAGIWIGAVTFVRRATAAMPPPVIQKARALMEDRKYDEAAALLLPVIQEIERTRGTEDPILVRHYDLLASIYDEMKKPAEAEPLWRRSWQILGKTLGPDHGDSISGGDRLARSLMAQGKYPEAEALFRKSLAHRERYWGADDHRVMASLNNLAELFLAQKKLPEAESFAGRAVKIGRAKTGLMPPAYAESMRLLASVYAAQEKYEDAAPLFDGAVKLKVRQLPDAPHIPPKAGQISHGDFADLCKDYASVLRKAGREKQAKEIEAKAEAVLKPRD